ncbi:hypothetical protein G6O69_06880 [Pseudenhygromyxa sp. WMMC2535]|uniref:hypothetical protein n=1 Tax=Pseudenhygromyxa sp. WMMC2535 TaxID=2712867 RepID=UPI001552B6E1|nr:hypothetical protein [Pseudenhygromyxa sp. WMMC2535]NVB37550.1 hypothetical protein [Pseudenhygromyxa sp. WMMC2535]
MVASALLTLLVLSPPALPPDIGDVPAADDGSGSGSGAAAEQSKDRGAEDAPGEDAAGEDVASEDVAGEDAAGEEPVGQDAVSEDPSAAEVSAGEEEAIPVSPAGTGGAAAAGAAAASAPTTIQTPTQPTPQVPTQTASTGASVQPVTPASAQPVTPASAQPVSTSTSASAYSSAQTAPTGSTSAASEAAEPVEDEAPEDEEPEYEEKTYRKLGGFRLFRVGIAPRIGYTHGTSDKNGIFDRDKSIQSSIDNGEVTATGAGDLGTTKFGGFQYGFILDAEVVGINVWLDFHKFFRPGGMWSLMLGYDHEFGFGERLRLDVGVGGGLNNVFLGDSLSALYYDEDNPESVNIATLGVEGRAMADLHIKLVGPLFTGPYAFLGYHYLWSANVSEVTVEKGLHYSLGWSLRLDFAAPKLIGGRRTKKVKKK